MLIVPLCLLLSSCNFHFFFCGIIPLFPTRLFFQMISSIFISSEDGSTHKALKIRSYFWYITRSLIGRTKIVSHLLYIHIFICTRIKGLNYNSVKEALHAQYMNKANNNTRTTHLIKIYVDHSLNLNHI
jgi:uncharacterized membrane protein (GlpM family)